MTNMPGVGLWGVAGIPKFMLRGGYVVQRTGAGALAWVSASFRWWLGTRASVQVQT